VAAALVRLHQVQAPLLDQMYVKQVYVANKARNIARAPLAPLRDTLDFLEEKRGHSGIILYQNVPFSTPRHRARFASAEAGGGGRVR